VVSCPDVANFAATVLGAIAPLLAPLRLTASCAMQRDKQVLCVRA
jgi:hypothetical protein